MTVLWLESGYTMKNCWSPREIPRAQPSGFPWGWGNISSDTPPLVTIQLQYTDAVYIWFYWLLFKHARGTMVDYIQYKILMNFTPLLNIIRPRKHPKSFFYYGCGKRAHRYLKSIYIFINILIVTQQRCLNCTLVVLNKFASSLKARLSVCLVYWPCLGLSPQY